MLKCRLLELAKKKDLSLAQVAKEINYRPNTLYALADNRLLYVDNELIVSLCIFFDCTIEELFYFEERNNIED